MMAQRALVASRLAALGLLAAFLGLGWVAIVQPAIDVWRGGQEANSDLATQLNHLTLVAERRPGVEASLRQLNVSLSDPALLWSGQSGPAVSASIQARLREIIDASGGGLQSTTNLPATLEHGLSRITLRLRTDGTVPALQAMLHGIDTSRPALFVDEITINAPDGGITAASQPPMLSIQLDVTGYSRTP